MFANFFTPAAADNFATGGGFIQFDAAYFVQHDAAPAIQPDAAPSGDANPTSVDEQGDAAPLDAFTERMLPTSLELIRANADMVPEEQREAATSWLTEEVLARLLSPATTTRCVALTDRICRSDRSHASRFSAAMHSLRRNLIVNGVRTRKRAAGEGADDDNAAGDSANRPRITPETRERITEWVDGVTAPPGATRTPAATEAPRPDVQAYLRHHERKVDAYFARQEARQAAQFGLALDVGAANVRDAQRASAAEDNGETAQHEAEHGDADSDATASAPNEAAGGATEGELVLRRVITPTPPPSSSSSSAGESDGSLPEQEQAEGVHAPRTFPFWTHDPRDIEAMEAAAAAAADEDEVGCLPRLGSGRIGLHDGSVLAADDAPSSGCASPGSMRSLPSSSSVASSSSAGGASRYAVPMSGTMAADRVLLYYPAAVLPVSPSSGSRRSSGDEGDVDSLFCLAGNHDSDGGDVEVYADGDVERAEAGGRDKGKQRDMDPAPPPPSMDAIDAAAAAAAEGRVLMVFDGMMAAAEAEALTSFDAYTYTCADLAWTYDFCHAAFGLGDDEARGEGSSSSSGGSSGRRGRAKEPPLSAAAIAAAVAAAAEGYE